MIGDDANHHDAHVTGQFGPSIATRHLADRLRAQVSPREQLTYRGREDERLFTQDPESD